MLTSAPPAPTSQAPRSRRRSRTLIAALALASVVAVTAYVESAGSADSVPTPQPVGDRLSSSIQRAQDRLRRLPDDAATWAALGASTVEQARVSANPMLYAQAQGALDRSLRLQPDGNAGALIGLGALANARHDFAAARHHAEAAIALQPATVEAYGVLADAATQLGDTEAATAAVQKMLDLRPGVASFTRAAYELELHGRIDDARAALDRAATAATSPEELAFCRYHLGELAWNSGDLAEAEAQYERGLTASPADPPLRHGRARVLAAQGRVAEAIDAYAQLTLRVPLPQYVLEYGELLESAGRLPEAQAQYQLLAQQHRLAAAQGATDDLAAAQVAADHGDPAEALRLAEAEWGRRQAIFTADALAWALHVNGRDAEALPLADRAASLGTRDATTAYHRGMILAALGRTGDAVAALDTALRTNPHFSPLHAAVARQTLEALR